MERNIKLLIEYRGTAYSGWQAQKEEKTVQGELLKAIQRVTGTHVSLYAAGRTDTGVHALGQVANFQIDHRLEAERFADAINYYLPDDVRVMKSEETGEDFHARFSALARRYRYLVAGEASAIYRDLRCHFRPKLDPDLLREAAGKVAGEHDFAPFCVMASRKESNVCTVTHSCWRRIGPLWVYEIQANRFLHSMVRSLVGAMLNLATAEPDQNPANLTLQSFSDIITAPTEDRIPFTAPACGLYLVRVIY